MRVPSNREINSGASQSRRFARLLVRATDAGEGLVRNAPTLH